MNKHEEQHYNLVVTTDGKSVAKHVLVDQEVPDSFGAMKGSVIYHDDIVAPDHESWAEHPAGEGGFSVCDARP